MVTPPSQPLSFSHFTTKGIRFQFYEWTLCENANNSGLITPLNDVFVSSHFDYCDISLFEKSVNEQKIIQNELQAKNQKTNKQDVIVPISQGFPLPTPDQLLGRPIKFSSQC